MPYFKHVSCAMHDSEDELLRAPYSLCAYRVVLATLFTLAIYSINTSNLRTLPHKPFLPLPLLLLLL